jgi:hypothetical protein
LKDPPPLGEKKSEIKSLESNKDTIDEPLYGHRGHYLRPLDEVLKKALNEKQKLKKDIKE